MRNGPGGQGMKAVVAKLSLLKNLSRDLHFSILLARCLTQILSHILSTNFEVSALHIVESHYMTDATQLEIGRTLVNTRMCFIFLKDAILL